MSHKTAPVLESSATRCASTVPTKTRLPSTATPRSEEHTSELQSLRHLVCRLPLSKKKAWRWTSPRSPPTGRRPPHARTGPERPYVSTDPAQTHHRRINQRQTNTPSHHLGNAPTP